MLKFFRIPFAQSGDKTAVPDAVDVNGFVSYTAGYGFDYQRQKTDPAAKNIERDKMNEIFFDITTALAELQSQGIPDFITSALNGGTAYSYGQYAVVRYSGDIYVSLVGTNTATPADATKWALLPVPSRLQAALYTRATAAGTADAITATYSPAIAALPAAPNTLSLMVRAGSANTTTTPTFKADGTTAKTIVKGANVALVAGDIAGAGHWLHLDYDATLDKWVLQNPAYGVASSLPVASTAEAQAGTDNTKAITPLRMREGFHAAGSAPVYACRAWVNFNGTGTVAIKASGNVSSITDNGTGDYTVNFATALPDANYAVAACGADDLNATVQVTSVTGGAPTLKSTTQLRITCAQGAPTATDMADVSISIFR